MDCKTARDQMSAYLDGELSREAGAAVSEHVRACPQCADALVRMRGVERLLDEIAAAEAPTGFAHAVRLAAERARDADRKIVAMPVGAGRRVLMRVAAMLALVLGIGLGGLVGASTCRVRQGSVTVAEAQESSDLSTEALKVVPSGSPVSDYLTWMGESE